MVGEPGITGREGKDDIGLDKYSAGEDGAGIVCPVGYGNGGKVFGNGGKDLLFETNGGNAGNVFGNVFGKLLEIGKTIAEGGNPGGSVVAGFNPVFTGIPFPGTIDVSGEVKCFPHVGLFRRSANSFDPTFTNLPVLGLKVKDIFLILFK